MTPPRSNITSFIISQRISVFSCNGQQGTGELCQKICRTNLHNHVEQMGEDDQRMLPMVLA